MKAKSIEWLTGAWADASGLADSISHALAEDPNRAVVLPNRQLVGAPSVMTLARLLREERRFPAIVVACAELIEFDRAALAEVLPHASIEVIDWCHPAPPEPADITLLCEGQLPRAAGTLAGYDAATVAIFTGIAATANARHHQALRQLLHTARNPLIVLEEWTHPDILTLAVARQAGITDAAAQPLVDRWLEQPFDAAAVRPPKQAPVGLLAVRELCQRPEQAAA